MPLLNRSRYALHSFPCFSRRKFPNRSVDFFDCDFLYNKLIFYYKNLIGAKTGNTNTFSYSFFFPYLSRPGNYKFHTFPNPVGTLTTELSLADLILLRPKPDSWSLHVDICERVLAQDN